MEQTQTTPAEHSLSVLTGAESDVRSRVLYTRTDYGRGEADYVRVYIAPNPDDIVDISYHVAMVIGAKMTDRGIKRMGGQYHKGMDTADCLARALGFELDQLNGWFELH